tara:strand:+ start:3181 stop:3747 length:567 start_codon:yes stop_codon:yes gene_type:complete
MPIKIKLGTAPEDTAPTPLPPQATVELRVRKTLGGNFLIKDHQMMDIVIMPESGRIAAIPKPSIGDNDKIYHHQKDLMDALFKGGVVEYDTIQGGLSFGVLESFFKKDVEGVDAVQVVLLEVEKYIKATASDGLYAEEYDQHIEDRFTDPNSSDSTELGAIKPQQDEPYAQSYTPAGSYTFSAYGYTY